MSVEIESNPMPRSRFLQVAVGGMCAGYVGIIGYPIFRYLSSPVEKAMVEAAVSEVSLKDADKLPMGTALMFKFGAHPALLIHHKDDSWVALDAVCTHLGCTVRFEPSEQKIVCSCHGGVYDAKTGGNISGPPPKPLKQFVAKVSPGSVLVTRA